MRKIIFDCDNTMGLPGHDVDDGLAFLYLLGSEDAEIIGITTTYGNHEIDAVDENMRKMICEVGHGEIPVMKGGRTPQDEQNDAAVFLAEMAEQYPSELEILATGSLTNLWGAGKKNPHFFEQVSQIVLMGGITEPLIFKKKEMKELNFSCDPAATYEVLTKGKQVSVITGNNCLKVLFEWAEYRKRLSADTTGAGEYILKKTRYWFDDNERVYGIEGFYNWDVLAAVYLMHPELFEDQEVAVALSVEDLGQGFLHPQEDGENRLNLPTVKEEKALKDSIYRTWAKVRMRRR